MDNRGFNQFNGDYQPHQLGRKKSKGLGILFGLIPGAGQMYLGKMNRGLTLMGIFWGDVGIGVILPPVLFLLPIIWFYSFFDALNLASLSQQELRDAPDEISVFADTMKSKGLRKPIASKGKWFGWALVLVGGYLLYEMLNSYLIYFLQNFTGYDFYWLREIFRAIPRAAIAALVVGLGFKLVKGGKKVEKEEDVRPYHGDYSGLNTASNGYGHYHSDGSYHAAVPGKEPAPPQRTAPEAPQQPVAPAYQAPVQQPAAPTQQAAAPAQPMAPVQQPASVQQMVEPELTVATPGLTVAEPELTVAAPELTVAEPELTMVKPELTVEESELTAVKPELTVEDTAAENIPVDLKLPEEKKATEAPKIELIAFVEDEEETYGTR